MIIDTHVYTYGIGAEVAATQHSLPYYNVARHVTL